MSAQADSILHQIQTLPAQDAEALYWELTAWFRKAGEAPMAEDPIRSARGMFRGSHLTAALLASREEERRRG